MHADEAHETKKGGFFSKIFGHQDSAATPDPNDPNVIHPEDAIAAGVGDMSTATPTPDPVAPSTPTDPAQAPSDPSMQSSTTSDVHAIPSGSHSPLDLTSATSTPAPSSHDTFDIPTPPAQETQAEQAIDTELAASAAQDAAVAEEPSFEAPSEDAPNSAPEPEATASEDDDLAILQAAQAEHAQKAAEPTPVVETPAEETPAEEPTATADVEPPTPPVEEGQAWQSSQTFAAEPEAPVAPTNSRFAGVQDEVKDILAARVDYTTDGANSATPGEEPAAADVTTPEASPDPAPEPTPEPVVEPTSETTPEPTPAPTPEAGPNPEIQAALARLEQHIEDLDNGLQKVRAELANLRDKI